MELFESLKQVFANSDEKIVLCDENMSTVWKNQDNLTDVIDTGRIRLYYNREFCLPVTNSETAEYKGEFGKSQALKIEPLRQNNEICGYLLHFYNCNDIEMISDRSGYLKYKSNFLGNIRIEMSRIINMLDLKKQSGAYENDIEFMRMDKEIRYRIQRTFSATANYNELAKYYNGFFDVKFINISTILEDISEEVSETFENNGCMFRYDIDEGIYLDMNDERLRTVIMNLLVNGYMYNSKDEKLCELSLKSDEENIIIRVSDNGNGIDEVTIKNSLEPFGNFRRFEQHEFLGLAVVKKFCDFFGGKIVFDTDSGNYTKVNLIFPKPSKDMPHDFKVSHMPPLINPYDTLTCVLAKGFDLSK